MTTVTLADPVTGVGSIATIDRFAVLGIDNENPDQTSVDAKDRYFVHQVEPFLRAIGIDVASPAVERAARAAGIEPENIFFEIIRLPQELVALSAEQGGLSDDDVAGRYEEIWVAAFGDLNDGLEGVSIENVQFVRVA